MKKRPRTTAILGTSKRSKARPDAVDSLEQFALRDPALREMVEEATINAIVAQIIYDARAEAKLTQGQLARLIGTRQSVISRLEDADYDGHSISMLRRIGDALGKRLEIRFVDRRKPRAA